MIINNLHLLPLLAFSLLMSCQSPKNATDDKNLANNGSPSADSIPPSRLPTTLNPELVFDNPDLLPKKEANELLFSQTWRLVAFTPNDGNPIAFYPMDRVYKFESKGAAFRKDCNDCSIGLIWDLDKMQVSTRQPLSMPCTELDCSYYEERQRKVFDHIVEFIPSPASKYQINKEKILSVFTKSGHYQFRVALGAADFPKKGLANSIWELVEYRNMRAEDKDFNYMRRPILLHFQPDGFNYTPDCNRCGYNGVISYENGKISLPSGKEFSISCTEKGCLDSKAEVSNLLITNGTSYEFEGGRLLLKNALYELKLRLYQNNQK